MLWGDDESNCKHKTAASADTKLAGWRRGPDRLPALVPSLNITFPILSLKNTLAPHRMAIMKYDLVPPVCSKQVSLLVITNYKKKKKKEMLRV